MYIKKYYSKIGYSIYYKNEFETKYVPNGEQSPKVIAWLAEGNEFEVIPFVEPVLSDLKAQKALEFKNQAALELLQTDYKVIRHFEQVDLGIETTLSGLDFENLMQARQAIRDKSNSLEAQVNALNTYDEIITINW